MLKIHIRLVVSFLLLTAFNPLFATDNINDTTYYFYFELNMTKAIQDGLFDPDSGQVYVDFDESLPDLLLLKSPNNVYNGLQIGGLDSGTTYHFRFRINDTIFESVNREATALPGTTDILAWWNDEYLNTTTFRIDASGIPDSTFSFGTDELQIDGEMNQWQPAPLQQVGSSKIFEITYHLDPNLYYEYVFRIEKDTIIIYEDLSGTTRMFLPPDTVIEVIQYFSNQDTGKIAVTFQCHMDIQQALGHFDPSTDYLDIAANFNNWGAWDLLYDQYQTGLYKTTQLFDKFMIGGDTLEFKFRINGSWALAELQGQDPREYVIQPYDTTFNPNTIEFWYNNVGPIVPSPPWVTDLFIQGQLAIKQILTGSYVYHNLSGIPEGNSLYKWYRADSVGATLSPIDSAWTINYTTDSIEDIGKYIVFEVTPVAADSGDSAVGLPAQVYTTGPIGGVGIQEFAQNQIRLYPNPVERVLTCEGTYEINRFEIYNISGMLVFSSNQLPQRRIQADVSNLPPGMYIFRAFSKGVLPVHQRFVKR